MSLKRSETSEFAAEFANDTFKLVNALAARVDVCAQRIQLNAATNPARVRVYDWPKSWAVACGSPYVT